MPEPDGAASNEASPHDAGGQRLGETATGAVASILDYLHARLALLALEAHEARGALIARFVCGVAGAFFLLIAYSAACAGLVGWLSRKMHWPWPLSTLGLAGVHLLAGVAMLLAVRRRFRRPPFRDSLNEWEKDRAWLNRHRNRKSNRSQ